MPNANEAKGRRELHELVLNIVSWYSGQDIQVGYIQDAWYSGQKIH